MEFKGTKGKWFFESLDDTFVRSSENRVTIAVMKGANYIYEETRANALLISKSPILLQAIYDSIQELKEAGLTAMAEYHEKLYFECVNL